MFSSSSLLIGEGLKDVLIFLTGTCSNSVSPMNFGFGGTITFTDIDQLPTVSICSVTLTFSRKMSTNFKRFKEVMDLVVGCKDFFDQL